MKAIFLDIDGVLTVPSTHFKTFHPDCIKALKHILDATGAVLVLSSCWRHGFLDWRGTEGKLVDSKDAVKVMKELLNDAGLQGERLIDKTPTLRSDIRGQEIDAWLKDTHPMSFDIKSFAILDDDSDMEPHMNRLVKVNGREGLTEEDTKNCIKMLDTPLTL